MHGICSSIVGNFCLCLGIGILCFIKLVMVLGLQMGPYITPRPFLCRNLIWHFWSSEKRLKCLPITREYRMNICIAHYSNVFSSWWHAYLSMIAFKILEQYGRLPGGVSTLTNCVCRNSMRGIHTPTHNWSFSLCWLCSKSCVFYEEIGGYLEVVWVKILEKKGRKSCMSKKLFSFTWKAFIVCWVYILWFVSEFGLSIIKILSNL